MAEAGWMIVTGAGAGIMEAGHVGAGRDASIGLNILLPFEQSANQVMTGNDKLMTMRYFFTRKLMFVKETDAIVLFPGGFGTLDELTEILTLMQTRKIDRHIPVVLYGASYWNELINFDALVRHGMIAEDDLRLFYTVDTPAEAMAVLQKHLVVDRDPSTPALAASKTPQGRP